MWLKEMKGLLPLVDWHDENDHLYPHCLVGDLNSVMAAVPARTIELNLEK